MPYILISASIIISLILAFSCREDLITVRYSVKSNKIKNKVKAVLLSDLHGAKYGNRQEKLFSILHKENPDIIFLAGDIVENRKRKQNDYDFTNRIGKEFRTFYTIGNHEVRTGRTDVIKKELTAKGIMIPDKKAWDIIINGNPLRIISLDDSEKYDREGHSEEWSSNFFKKEALCDPSFFNILLSHHPNHPELYFDGKFDLVLSGHAHGGQIRLPFTNGLWAPGEGFLPKYAGGIFYKNSTCQIISRGLSKDCFPRVFNKPEIVVISIE